MREECHGRAAELDAPFPDLLGEQLARGVLAMSILPWDIRRLFEELHGTWQLLVATHQYAEYYPQFVAGIDLEFFDTGELRAIFHPDNKGFVMAMHAALQHPDLLERFGQQIEEHDLYVDDFSHVVELVEGLDEQ